MTKGIQGLPIENLTPSAGTWLAVAPSIVLLSYLAGGLIAYWIRTLVAGTYRDVHLLERDASGIAGSWLGHYFAWVMMPIWALLRRSGLPPNAISSLSVLLSVGSAFAIARGSFAFGGALFVFAGTCDYFDGRLARHLGRTSRAGSALDSVFDRYSDAFVLMGLAWFYRHHWALVPCLFAMLGSALVPYIRAKGEALGVVMKDVGTMQRPERIAMLGGAVVISPLVVALNPSLDSMGDHWLVIVVIVVLAVVTHVTALQRLFHLLHQLD
jgi:phosphatidylglycerophosphate synthase